MVYFTKLIVFKYKPCFLWYLSMSDALRPTRSHLIVRQTRSTKTLPGQAPRPSVDSLTPATRQIDNLLNRKLTALVRVDDVRLAKARKGLSQCFHRVKPFSVALSGTPRFVDANIDHRGQTHESLVMRMQVGPASRPACAANGGEHSIDITVSV
jgi:hypothetical protein